MAGSIGPQSNFGAFLPTTNVWDVTRISQVDIKSPEFKELLVRLYQNVNNISILLNLKDTGYYDTTQFVNGQLFFPNPNLDSSSSTTPTYRQVFRQVINFGALPNNATLSVPHNIDITTTFTFTRIYGTSSASDGTSFIPLPYASPTAANNIELIVTNTDVLITTGIDYSAYTTTYIVIEWLQQ